MLISFYMIEIEGLVFPLGVLNLNDWGVPLTEEETAITTAEGAKVRICSRVDPHFCDVIGDPSSEIGSVINAWTEGEGADKAIYAKAVIKDSIAAQKIEDGVWKNAWSVFLNYQTIDSGGWVHGVQIESITLVDDPAWPTATWKVVSAANGSRKLLYRSTYKLTTKSTKQGGNMPKTNEELEAENARLKEENEKLKGGGGTPEGGEGPREGVEDGGTPEGTEEGTGDGGTPGGPEEGTGDGGTPGGAGDGGAQGMAALRSENATLKKQMATMVTAAAVSKMVQDAIEKDHKKQASLREREEAFKAFASVRASIGMETKPEEFKEFGAAEITKFTEDLLGLKNQVESKGSGMVFTASQNTQSGSTVGRWDSKTKTYVN